MLYSEIKVGENYTAVISLGNTPVHVKIVKKAIHGRYRIITYEYLGGFIHPVSNARHGMMYSETRIFNRLYP